MSQTTSLHQIEDLTVNQLAEALESNGYAECVGAICTKQIDGQAFLRLTELQISLWRLPSIQARRLWSFIQQIRQDPKEFLINCKASTKVTPKVNTLKNLPICEQVIMESNLTYKSNYSSNKPNIALKPYNSNQLHKFAQESENTEANFSTLTKQESKLIKNKLEQVFKKESLDTLNTSFIYSHKEKEPRLPLKPEHSRTVPSNDDKYEESPDDFNDGYLSPINVDPNQRETKLEEPVNQRHSSVTVLRSNSTNSSSFLNRIRKGYENLEIRPKVIQNNYEEQNIKPTKLAVQNRPLPPIPKETKNSYAPDIEFETDDRELADYTPVLNDEKSNLREEKHIKQKHEKVHRLLPAVTPTKVDKTNQLLPVQQSEYPSTLDDGKGLAEYTPVVENENEYIGASTQATTKPFYHSLPSLHNHPPSISVSSINKSFRVKKRPKLPTPDLPDQEELILKTQKISVNTKSPLNKLRSPVAPPKSPVKLLKPRAELPKSPVSLPKSSTNLPKPPSNLPKPPLDLPAPPDFLVKSQDELLGFDTAHFNILNKLQNKSLGVPPSQQKAEPVANMGLNTVEDEFLFYSEIDIASEPSYRETDRKGARQLLTGLEDGAFVIRPSRQAQYICTFSIMHRTKMFNLGIERDSEGALVFGSVQPDFDQPKFYSVGEIVAYYSVHPLYLSGESIVLKDILPRNKR